MNNWWIVAILLIALGGVFGMGYLIGSRSVEPVVEQVEATINIDSLHNVWLTTYASKLPKDTIDRWLKPDVVHDTPYKPGPSPQFVDYYRADTTIDANVTATIVQGEDTVTQTATAGVRMSLSFVGEPYNRIGINTLRVLPFSLGIPVKKEPCELPHGRDWNTWFSMHAICGWGRNAGAGGLVHVGWLGGGFIAMHRDQPFWFATVRIGQ